MAWVAEAKFKSSFTNRVGTSPFGGGSNRVLSCMGSGAILRDEPAITNIANVECRIDCVFKNYFNQGGDAAPPQIENFGIILRHAGLAVSADDFYWFAIAPYSLSGGLRIAGTIYYYDSGGNTFNILATGNESVFPLFTDFNLIFQLAARADGTNLSMRVNGIPIVGVTDSNIASGAVGVGGQLFVPNPPGGFFKNAIMFSDILQVLTF